LRHSNLSLLLALTGAVALTAAVPAPKSTVTDSIPHAAAPQPAASAPASFTPPMRHYVFGILRKGPKWRPGSSPALDSLQAAHLAHIRSMWKAGALVAAGPVSGSDDWRGLLIFGADSTAPMRALAEQDPSVRAGRLKVDLWTWYAPSGIGQGYNRRVARLGEGSDSMVTRWAVFLHRGPTFTTEMSTQHTSLMRDHMSHIYDEIASRRAPASGPLGGTNESDPIGLCIFATDSVQAWTRANADPAVQSGHFRIQMVRWWCAYGVLPGEEGS
jgi:uncharacterized protein YciI